MTSCCETGCTLFKSMLSNSPKSLTGHTIKLVRIQVRRLLNYLKQGLWVTCWDNAPILTGANQFASGAYFAVAYTC
jgi:hypothetical protein